MRTNFSIAAAVLAATLGFGTLATPANAQVDVDVYLGIPHYDRRMGPDYVYRRGHGWYLPRDEFRDGRYGRLSCNEARRIVRRNGFRNVETRECQGRTYTFFATRNGRDVRIYVNSRTGRITRG
jgi:hypothetical protein